MWVTILIVLINSIVLSMSGGNILPIPIFLILLTFGVLNGWLSIVLYEKHQVFWIITGISSLIFLLLSFAHAPLWLQILGLLMLGFVWNLFHPLVKDSI